MKKRVYLCVIISLNKYNQNMNYSQTISVRIRFAQNSIKRMELQKELYDYCVAIECQAKYAERIAEGSGFSAFGGRVPFPNNMQLSEQEADNINLLLDKIALVDAADKDIQ